MSAATILHQIGKFAPQKFVRFTSLRYIGQKQAEHDGERTRCQRSHDDGDDDDAIHHFGFQRVNEKEKYKKVHKVFENVAEKYDLMNDVMSAGVHRLWKDYFISQLAPPQGTKLLDVAGGTGDLAFKFLSYINKEKSDDVDSMSPTNPFDLKSDDIDRDCLIIDAEKKSHVTVCDISESMLQHGRNRADQMGFSEKDISWVLGNAEDLPFCDDTFDAYTISFGIRNCTHLDKVLNEANRVLKPAGRFMCLEFSNVDNPVIRRLYDSYSFQIIPIMGQIFARDWDSYQYLVESIRRFPSQEQFTEMVKNAGFDMVTHENLTFGVAAIHSAYKVYSK